MSKEKTTFLFIGTGGFDGEPGKVVVFRLERPLGELTQLNEFAAGQLASFLTIDTERARLFVADEAGGGVLSFSVDPKTGNLTALGGASSDNQPVYLSHTLDGRYLLAANYNQGSVDVYPIDERGRAGASLGTTPTGREAHCIVLGNEQRVYVANKGQNTISMLSFAEGTLTRTEVMNFPSPRHIVLRSKRAFVVSEEADVVRSFSLGPQGEWSFLWESTRLRAGESSPQEDTGADVLLTPNGQFLYVSNRGTSNSVVGFDLSGTAPRYLEHQSTQGDTPRKLAMDPRGEFLVAGNHGERRSVTVFSILADGTLDHRKTFPTPFSPYFLGFAEF